MIPLIPIALATGWSALILFALRIPLNPMSATLGALVIAISTEFGVLLSARYRAERVAGRPAAQALERTYRSTGSAVLASGATAIAGFAVLILSNIRMLRDFGFVTVVDLTVSLLGVMVVLPAALVLAERGELLASPRAGVGARQAPAGPAAPRARRRVAVSARGPLDFEEEPPASSRRRRPRPRRRRRRRPAGPARGRRGWWAWRSSRSSPTSR